MQRFIVLDTETTGLHPETGDKMVQLSIIDQDGNVLFDEYIKPGCKKRWDEAQEVHGISPEMVADRPTFRYFREQVQEIIDSYDCIIGYNLNFDLRFLVNEGIVLNTSGNQVTYDLMPDFAEVFGDWNNYRQSYTWKKLTVCAAYYGYDWSAHGEAHNSLADCYATLYCYNAYMMSKMLGA